MVEIFFTTPDFGVAGQPQPGIPFLLNREMLPLSPFNAYLESVCIESGKTRSPNTWNTYGYALYHFSHWLETFGKDWGKVAVRDIANYRNAMQQNPNIHGRDYSVSTINGRLTIILQFYKWCFQEGLIDHIPFMMKTVRVNKRQTFFKHNDASGGMMDVSDMHLKEYERDYEFLLEPQVVEILRMLKRREQLEVAIILESGMRRSEMIELTVNQIPDPQMYQTSRKVPITINGKGNKQRTVFISKTTLNELHKYIVWERPALLKKYKKKNGKTTNKLWLTRTGTELKKGTFNNIMRRVSQLTKTKANPHIFRHTFAYNYYHRTKDLATLQKLLGHSSPTTTAKYVHTVDADLEMGEALVFDDFNKMFSEAIGDYGKNNG